MSLLEQLTEGCTVTVDTAPIIYMLDGNETFAPHYRPLFTAVEQGLLDAVVSTITIAEVLAGPLGSGDEILAARYLDVLTRSPGWTVWDLTTEVAETAARVRVQTRLRLPDAVQVATALASGSAALVTHDRDFETVEGMRVLF